MTEAASPCPGDIGEDGFTLVELLVAILLLMIGFLAVITVFWTSASSGTFTRQMTTAACLGEEMLERAKTLSYNSLGTTSGFVNYTASNASARSFSRRWSITESGGVKTITAEISWGGGTMGPKKRTFTMTKRSDY
jgi:type IV pilus assembly protein PilV